MRRACFNINLLGNVLGIALCLYLQPSNHTAVQAAQAQSQPCLSAALRGLPCHCQGPRGRIPLGSIGRPSRVPQGCAVQGSATACAFLGARPSACREEQLLGARLERLAAVAGPVVAVGKPELVSVDRVHISVVLSF